MPGRTVVQWDKEDCADLGIIKVDLLGLGMMAVIQESLVLVGQHYDEPIDLAQLPQDPLVYETLQRADTVGMFQVESRAQMASLPRNHRKNSMTWWCRWPSSGQGLLWQDDAPLHAPQAEKRGRHLPHPSLEPVLKRTLGVPLFQEQLLRMAMTVADFTGAEAEELRRAVRMRRSWQRMEQLEVKLRAA